MTFKGMLKILVNDYKKQHEEKMYTIANELIQTRRELSQVKEQLRHLHPDCPPPSSETYNIPVLTISLFVQYNGFFNQLCEIHLSMTIRELLIQLRQITGISLEHLIRLRVLSEDGLTTLFFLDKELDRTLESYATELKARMILSIENDDDDEEESHSHRSKIMTSSEQTHSYESDV